MKLALAILSLFVVGVASTLATQGNLFSIPPGPSSTKDSKQIELQFSYFNGRPMGKVNVSLTDTIWRIKVDQLEVLDEGVDASMMMLIYNCNPMDNNRTVASYNMKDGARIDYQDWGVTLEEEKQTIATKKLVVSDDESVGFKLMRLTDGAMTDALFKLSQPISDVKEFIVKKDNLISERAFLFFNHIVLDPKRTLYYYNVRSDSLVAYGQLTHDCNQ